MDGIQFLLGQHAQVHSTAVAVPETGFGLEDLIFMSLDDTSARCRPGPAFNSVAWLVWHMARCEDVAVNVVIGDREQVLDDSWLERLKLQRTDIGTGMEEEEVSRLSEAVDIPALRDYRASVGRRTREVLAGVDAAQIATVAPPERVERAFASGAVEAESGQWLKGFWQGRTLGWFLWLANGHNYWHLGEANVVVNAMGRGAGR
jgi:hypothetical protein